MPDDNEGSHAQDRVGEPDSTTDDQAARRLVAAYHEAGHVVVADALGILWEWAYVPDKGRGRTRLRSQVNAPEPSPADLSAFGWAGTVAEHRLLV